MAKFPNCPKCGSDSGFLVKLRARGSAVNQFDLDGRFLERDDDRTWFEPVSEAVRCADCLGIRPDVRRDCTEIISIEIAG